MAKSKNGLRSLEMRNRDKDFLKNMARTGIVSSLDIGKGKSHHLSDDRLQRLEKHGYIQSKIVDCNNGKDQIKIYRLNEKGHEWVRRYTNIDYFYRTNTRQLDHDLKLSSIYNSLPPEVRETWKCDAVLQKEYSNVNYSAHGMIDAAITVDGVMIGIEVIGRSYSEETIVAKAEIATQIGCGVYLTYDGF